MTTMSKHVQIPVIFCFTIVGVEVVIGPKSSVARAGGVCGVCSP